MSTEKEIIRELNIVFEKLGWKLLSEDNKYPNPDNCKTYKWDMIIVFNTLFIDRIYIPYKKYTNKFTIKQLDNYVIEFIKNICLKGGLKRITFDNRADYWGDNTIELK